MDPDSVPMYSGDIAMILMPAHRLRTVLAFSGASVLGCTTRSEPPPVAPQAVTPERKQTAGANSSPKGEVESPEPTGAPPPTEEKSRPENETSPRDTATAELPPPRRSSIEWEMEKSTEPSLIQEEQEHLASAYAELEEMNSEGFLARAFLSQAVRPAFEIPEGELQHTEVSSYPVTGEKEWTLLWVNHGGLDHVLLVVDSRGKVHDRVRIEGRARVSLRDVISDDTEEIFVARILGTGLSTYPTEWSIYRVTDWGKLRLVLSHPKSHASGSKFLSWAFVNHFDFEDSKNLQVRTVHSECEDDEFVPRCPALGQTEYFTYSPAQDRYLKTAAPKPPAGVPSKRAGKLSGKPVPQRVPPSKKPAPHLKTEF